jgi:large subunit ribosomal protein L25
MADSVTLATQKRTERGTHAARRMRKAGQIPAVLYGHKEEAVSLVVSGDEVLSAVRHGVRVVDLQTDGGAPEKVLIRDVQWDHLGKELLHVDFTRVAADERIHVTVPIELKGVAPGALGAGVLDQPLHALEVECLALQVPDSIRVNISELQIGQAIHVRELHLPEGVKALADPDAVVVHVTAKQAEPEPTAAPAGAAEPEVIGRKAGEEEAEEK